MKPLIAASCWLLLAQSAHADATLRYRMDGACPVLAESIEISGSRLRVETVMDGERFVSVFDGDEDLLTSLMPADRTYHQTEVDEDAADYTADVSASTTVFMDKQMAQVGERLREQCAQLQKQSKGFDCSQMMDLQAMMTTAVPATAALSVVDTGRDETIGDVTCRWREWTQAARKTREECDAGATALPLPDADRRGLARGIKVMQRFTDSFSAMRDRYGGDASPAAPKGQLPVAVRCFGPDGRPTGQVRLDIVQTPLDPARFGIPDGYVEMMQVDAAPDAGTRKR
jgi:hypothetical protein